MTNAGPKVRAQFLKLESVTLRRLFASIIKHPLLFLAPIFLITSAVTGSAIRKNLYRCSASLWFESESVTATPGSRAQRQKDLVDRKVNLANSLLVGEPIRRLLTRIWPDVDPESDPINYNSLLNRLRGSGGIQIEFQRDVPEAINIAFQGPDPDLAFRIVQATMDELLALNKERDVGGSKARVQFLTKELEINSEKLRTNEEKMSAIEESLPPGALRNSPTTGTSSQSEKRPRALVEMEMSLALSEKGYERMAQSLKDLQKGEKLAGTGEGTIDQNYEDDPLMKQYSKLITEKEQALGKIIAEGYLPAHPKRKSAELELENLRQTKEKHFQELLETKAVNPLDSPAQRAAIERLRQALSTKKAEIDTLKDKIKIFKEQQPLEENPKDQKTDEADVTRQLELYRTLEIETNILSENQRKIQQQLEDARQKERHAEKEGGFNISVTEAPIRPIAPLPKFFLALFLLSLVFATGISVGLMFILSLLDTSVTSVAELQSVTKVPILGQVDRILTAQEAHSSRHKMTVGFIRLGALSVFVFFVSIFVF